MIAIAGGKGGSGKTTTTLGLARALARTDRAVVAADADRDMPNLHALAGVPRTPSLAAVEESADRDLNPAAVAHEDPTVAGVRVLPAPTDAATLDAAALSRLRRSSRRVLLDCPAGAGPDAAAPLRAADAALVVSLPTPESLRDAAKTAAMARALDARVAGAVVTRTETPPEGVERLLNTDRVFAVPDGGEDPLASRAVCRSFRRLATALPG